MTVRAFLQLAILGLSTVATHAPASAEGTVVAGRHGAWTLHVNDGKSVKLCFVTAEPETSEPKTSARAPALLYVSAWPKDGIKTEISVKAGYPLKAGADVKVTVDRDTFKLFSKDERAYVADATQELKLIEAMKKASRLKVEAKGERNAGTTDTYSLSGFTDALAALAAACP